MWKTIFIDLVNPLKGEKIIDIGSGSGDLVLEIQKKNSSSIIDIVDLNQEMLNEGKKRINKGNVKFYLQNAEDLKFDNNTYDKYLISFCLRNITNIDHALKEAFRVLKPGGRYYCMEFSKPLSIPLSKIYSYYKSNFIPLFGRIFSNNEEAYNYLNQSIDMFPNQEILKNKIEIYFDPKHTSMNKIIETIYKTDLKILDLSTKNVRLEEVFVNLIKDN